MNRLHHIRLAAGMIVGLVSLAASGCGAPSYCAAGSFPSFVEEEWRAYCVSYKDHVEAPGNYTLLELTNFLNEHPARAAYLKKSLGKYEAPDRCFQSPREKLDYRNLSSCLDHDDSQRLTIINAWKARAEPWISEHELRSLNVQPKLGDLVRDGSRLLRKVNEAFDFQVEMDPAKYLDWRDRLEAESQTVDATAQITDEWRELLQATESEYLRAAMLADIGPRVAEVSDDVIEQRDRMDELKATNRYLELAVSATGKPCPMGVSSRKEKKAAESALVKQMATIAATEPRIASKITPDDRGTEEAEFFDGWVCGLRPEEKQLKGQPQLCSVYAYRLERVRPKGERKWGDWKVMEFVEGGVKEGVDCGLNK